MADAFGRQRGEQDYDETTEQDQPNSLPGSPAPPSTADVATPQQLAASIQNPTSSSQTQPGGAQALPRPAPVAGAVYNSDTETPEQLVARYKADYHSPDASSVDSQLADWLKNPNAAQAPAPTSSSPDFSTQAGQLAYITPLLQKAGFGGDDPNYWVGRINQTGGFTPENLAYWEKNIASGMAGRQPGGQYYDAGPAQAAANAPGPYDAQISDEIEKLLADANTPTDENSPAIKGAVGAYRNARTFASDRSREKLAEQAAYEGMGSGAFDTAIQSELEQSGRDTASYQGSLISQELQRKADEIKTALSTATGSNAQRLQLQLAQIQDQLSRTQMGQQNQQFYDKLTSDMGSNASSLDQELLKYLTSGA